MRGRDDDLNIVMYHYVRPILGVKPQHKGLELDGFRRQLDFLTSQFNVIKAEQLLAAIRDGDSLPLTLVGSRSTTGTGTITSLYYQS